MPHCAARAGAGSRTECEPDRKILQTRGRRSCLHVELRQSIHSSLADDSVMGRVGGGEWGSGGMGELLEGPTMSQASNEELKTLLSRVADASLYYPEYRYRAWGYGEWIAMEGLLAAARFCGKPRYQGF